jgi:uncharacterized protein YtpQ (UPF0354 family)
MSLTRSVKWSACALALLLTAVLCARVAVAALSPEAFTQEYVGLLRAALPAHKVEIVKPLEVRITGADGTDSTAYLNNAYQQAQSDPDARQEILERYVGSVTSSVNPQPVKAENIVPIIKDRAWLAETSAAVSRKAGDDGKVARVFEDFNELLVIVYAEDTPSNIRYFSPGDLTKAGIERGRLRALAVSNLRRVLPKIEFHEGELFSMVTAGGNYEASLLLFDELWTGDRLKVDGEPVVAVPSRDVLLVTGSRNAEGIDRLRKVTQEIIAESTYTLTAELLVYRNGRFTRFE